MRQYSSYKCTGVSWLTEIPAEWKTARLKTCVNPITERAENNNGYIGLENIESWTGRYTSKKKNEAFEAEGTSISIHKGNVLFGKLRPYLAKCYVAESEGCCSTEFIVMDPKGIDSSFLKYLILSPSFIDNVNMSTYGSKMPRANWNYIGNMVIPIPNVEDQHGIVSYLNHKIGQIDTIIDETNATIEEFKQWKASIIYEVVTKGLNPSVEMVDSGVEWVGRIPSTWSVVKLKNVITQIESGVSVNAAQTPAPEGKIGVLKTSAVSKYVFMPEENKEVNADEIGRVACPVKGNTIIVSRMNTPDLVGAAGYVDRDYSMLFLPDRLWQVHFNVEKVEVKYIWYYLCSNYIKNYYSSQSSGTSSSMQNISKGQFENAILLLPKKSDQFAAVEFLDKKCASIESIITEKEALISDLDAYKKSLIFEVVTGKRKVV